MTGPHIGPHRGAHGRSRRGRSIAYHLTPAAAWASGDPGEPFRPASLDTEGFVHLTHRMDDLLAVADLFYRDEPGSHVVLTIDLGRLDAPWQYDGDSRYPHVYGSLDRASIVEVRSMVRDASGRFLGASELPAARP